MFMVIWDIESMARDNEKKIEWAGSLIRSTKGNIKCMQVSIRLKMYALIYVFIQSSSRQCLLVLIYIYIYINIVEDS